MPLTSAGFEALRAADFIRLGRQAYEDRLSAAGYTDVPDWERDTFLGQTIAVMGVLLGQLSEGQQHIYDALDEANATGVQADNLAALTGVYRQAATYSQATVTLTGTPGTVIPAGSLVRGGGDDGQAEWALDAEATIGGGGTVDAVVVAVEAGAVVGLIGAINQILDAVTGWDEVTNAAAADVGSAVERDAELLARRRQSFQVGAWSSITALESNIRELSYIDAVAVVENNTEDTVSIAGLTLLPHSFHAVIYPDDLTADQKLEIAETLATRAPAGIYSNGDDEEYTVITSSGATKVIRWTYATDEAVTVDVELEIDSTYTAAAVIEAAEDAILAYVADLAVGDPLRRLDLYGVLAAIDGIDGVTLIEINGSATDFVATLAQRVTLAEGDLSVTEA